MSVISDKRIQYFLEEMPLYTKKTFLRSHRDGIWINGIEAFCPTCELSRPFKDIVSRGSGAVGSGGVYKKTEFKSGTYKYTFRCASCHKSEIEILVEYIVTDKDITLSKYGELPRKKLERSPILENFFSDDSENLEKATVCLSSGYGVAAFAYYRRIIENNILNLLDLIKADVLETENDKDNLKAIEKLKVNTPMSEKIKIANNALPSYLVPDGLNPLGSLYKVLSDGVHSLSDEECLQKSQIIKECIMYLVGELASREKHRKQFTKIIGKL